MDSAFIVSTDYLASRPPCRRPIYWVVITDWSPSLTNPSTKELAQIWPSADKKCREQGNCNSLINHLISVVDITCSLISKVLLGWVCPVWDNEMIHLFNKPIPVLLFSLASVTVISVCRSTLRIIIWGGCNLLSCNLGMIKDLPKYYCELCSCLSWSGIYSNNYCQVILKSV